MEAKAKFLGHPIHQMLIVFPLGLLATAVIFDVIYLVTGTPTMAVVAYWMIAAGLLGGLVAAPFGLVDWFSIPDGTRAKSVGLRHAAGNVLALVLFATSWFLRGDRPEDPSTTAFVLALAGAGVAAVSGWLGGELVGRLGVGVDDGAHLDAPSSLEGPARAEGGR